MWLLHNRRSRQVQALGVMGGQNMVVQLWMCEEQIYWQ